MNKTPRISLRLSKSFFGRLLTVVAVVFVWRGLWGLMDIYLFPDNQVLSYVSSLLAGLFILYLPDDDIKELVNE